MGLLSFGSKLTGLLPTDFARVSTRLPTRGPEDPMLGGLIADTQTMLRNPSAPQNLEMMTRTYPGMKGLLSEDPAQTAENIIGQMKGNIISLYELAQRFELTPEKTSGVLAVLSPQKDWYQNVGLGERLIKSFAEVNQNLQTRWTPDMDVVAMTSAADKAGETAWTRNPIFENEVRGWSYGAMDTPEKKAMWLRAYDEAKHGRDYREVSPEGDILDYATAGSGEKRKIVHQSFSNMGKAISILESDGSLGAISDYLGSEHKVRNFFNNIYSPNSPFDLTADTHQIAGGIFMPYGSSAPEVGHGLSGQSAPKAGMPWSKAGHPETGSTAAYGLYADATARAAEEVGGWIPRQMQSITWEQLRALMPPTIRGNHPFVASARSIWDLKDQG